MFCAINQIVQTPERRTFHQLFHLFVGTSRNLPEADSGEDFSNWPWGLPGKDFVNNQKVVAKNEEKH